MSDEKRKLNEKRVQDFVDEAMARTAATGIGLVFRLGGTMEQATKIARHLMEQARRTDRERRAKLQSLN